MPFYRQRYRKPEYVGPSFEQSFKTGLAQGIAQALTEIPIELGKYHFITKPMKERELASEEERARLARETQTQLAQADLQQRMGLEAKKVERETGEAYAKQAEEERKRAAGVIEARTKAGEYVSREGQEPVPEIPAEVIQPKGWTQRTLKEPSDIFSKAAWAPVSRILIEPEGKAILPKEYPEVEGPFSPEAIFTGKPGKPGIEAIPGPEITVSPTEGRVLRGGVHGTPEEYKAAGLPWTKAVLTKPLASLPGRAGEGKTGRGEARVNLRKIESDMEDLARQGRADDALGMSKEANDSRTKAGLPAKSYAPDVERWRQEGPKSKKAPATPWDKAADKHGKLTPANATRFEASYKAYGGSDSVELEAIANAKKEKKPARKGGGLGF